MTTQEKFSIASITVCWLAVAGQTIGGLAIISDNSLLLLKGEYSGWAWLNYFITSFIAFWILLVGMFLGQKLRRAPLLAFILVTIPVVLTFLLFKPNFAVQID